jgi:hypothetical protein
LIKEWLVVSDYWRVTMKTKKELEKKIEEFITNIEREEGGIPFGFEVKYEICDSIDYLIRLKNGTHYKKWTLRVSELPSTSKKKIFYWDLKRGNDGSFYVEEWEFKELKNKLTDEGESLINEWDEYDKKEWPKISHLAEEIKDFLTALKFEVKDESWNSGPRNITTIYYDRIDFHYEGYYYYWTLRVSNHSPNPDLTERDFDLLYDRKDDGSFYLIKGELEKLKSGLTGKRDTLIGELDKLAVLKNSNADDMFKKEEEKLFMQYKRLKKYRK